MHTDAIKQAREWVQQADVFVFSAGAGMGVDAGLPDFKGNTGFWKAYPPFESLNIDFQSAANPSFFRNDPERAWGFYGHRLNLYRRTPPHEGYNILRQLADNKPNFIFTTNVDGHFAKAGFDPENIVECHGSIHHIQCTTPCSEAIEDANFEIQVDESQCRAQRPLPRCPHCGALARPNILMFGDYPWVSDRTHAQHERYEDFLDSLRSQPSSMKVVIECGAGVHIPTARGASEDLVRKGFHLIRINPNDYDVPKDCQARSVGLPLGALQALRALTVP